MDLGDTFRSRDLVDRDETWVDFILFIYLFFFFDGGQIRSRVHC